MSIQLKHIQQEAQLLQKDCVMRYVSKFVLYLTRYWKQKGFKQQK